MAQLGSRNNNAKLTEADVSAIWASANPAPAEAARYGVSKVTIDKIRGRKAWTDVTDNLGPQPERRPKRQQAPRRASRSHSERPPAPPSPEVSLERSASMTRPSDPMGGLRGIIAAALKPIILDAVREAMTELFELPPDGLPLGGNVAPASPKPKARKSRKAEPVPELEDDGEPFDSLFERIEDDWSGGQPPKEAERDPGAEPDGEPDAGLEPLTGEEADRHRRAYMASLGIAWPD